MESEAQDILDLCELAEMENEPSAVDDAPAILDSIQEQLDQLEMQRILSGEFDNSNAYVSFSPGAGGVDSADWADMLFRMINRYCDNMSFKVELVNYTPNEEAGLKSATLRVIGDFAYGYLKSERGIHRLVRISPFDSNARRHTSFAAVDITPEIDDNIEVEINDKDLKVDTYRASGAGGQHVNKTDSAVRMTHIPTGIVVQCQNERSQHKNRAWALKELRSRIFEKEMQKRREESQQRNDEKMDNAWGSQIRSYVLAPYQLVKDTRTGHETGKVDDVLNGNLNPFVKAYLLSNS
jgi:peptide chain release factor 2